MKLDYQYTKAANLLAYLKKIDPDMILVDIDDTLLTYEPCVIESRAVQNSWYHKLYSIFGTMKTDTNADGPVAVLPELNDWLIKQADIMPLIGITNRHVKYAGITADECSELGIRFATIQDEHNFKHNNNPILSHGIINCGYRRYDHYAESKGATFEDFVKAIENGLLPNLTEPKSILFIDDILFNIHMMGYACDKLGIDYYAVYLTTVNDATLDQSSNEIAIISYIGSDATEQNELYQSTPIPSGW